MHEFRNVPNITERSIQNLVKHLRKRLILDVWQGSEYSFE